MNEEIKGHLDLQDQQYNAEMTSRNNSGHGELLQGDDGERGPKGSPGRLGQPGRAGAKGSAGPQGPPGLPVGQIIH